MQEQTGVWTTVGNEIDEIVAISRQKRTLHLYSVSEHSLIGCGGAEHVDAPLHIVSRRR